MQGLNENNNSKSEKNKYLRAWETSRENADIYSLISRHRKTIKELAKGYLIRSNFILAENFIRLLRETFPNATISNTQWKMVVSIADKEKNGQIDIDLFFDLISSSSKINVSVPKVVR